MPTVLIYRHTLGKRSEPWVVTQSRFYSAFTPRFLARERAAGSVDPAEALVFGNFSRLERLLHGVTASPRAAERILGGASCAPVLVHAHFGFDGLYAARLAQALSIPCVITLHGIDVAAKDSALLLSGKLAWLRYLFGRSALGRDCAAFICVSEHVRRLASKVFPEAKLHLGYLGIDAEAFAFSALPKKRQILFVGRLVEKKGVLDLIAAFAEVRRGDPDVNLVVVGDGPLLGEVNEAIRGLDISGSVRHLASATQSEIRALLAESLVFCLPSRTAKNGDTEGLPISLLEAMAVGRPVVSTVHAGIPEAVVHGSTGLLVPEGDRVALAAALSRVTSNFGLAVALGEAGRRRIEEVFDARKCAAHTESLYKSVLEGGSS